jgi:hypothetical protein
MKLACDFCGGKATVWQGEDAWCFSCHGKHEFATWEPKLQIWLSPTPLQCLFALVMFWIITPICRLIPARWLVWHPETRRGRFTAWAYGWSYFWAERSEGRV